MHVTRRTLETCISNDLAKAADVGSDDQPAAHHLLNSRQSRSFLPNRGHDHNTNIIERFGERRTLQESSNLDKIPHPDPPDDRFELRSLRSISDQQQRKLVPLPL